MLAVVCSGVGAQEQIGDIEAVGICDRASCALSPHTRAHVCVVVVGC